MTKGIVTSMWALSAWGLLSCSTEPNADSSQTQSNPTLAQELISSNWTSGCVIGEPSEQGILSTFGVMPPSYYKPSAEKIAGHISAVETVAFRSLSSSKVQANFKREFFLGSQCNPGQIALTETFQIEAKIVGNRIEFQNGGHLQWQYPVTFVNENPGIRGVTLPMISLGAEIVYFAKGQDRFERVCASDTGSSHEPRLSRDSTINEAGKECQALGFQPDDRVVRQYGDRLELSVDVGHLVPLSYGWTKGR